MKQQYITLLSLNGIKGGRKTSYMACQQKNSIVLTIFVKVQSSKQTFLNFLILGKSRLPPKKVL